MKAFFWMWRQREMIKALVKNDLKSRYAGSFFGLVWAFVQPVMTILVFWYVFELGFRTAPVNNVRFILWFIPAYIPWVYFQDAVIGTSNCLREYSYLVKKIKFPVHVLPAVKILSSLVIHSFFIVFMIVIFFIYRYHLSVLTFQMAYYIAAMTFLLAGLGFLMSAVAVFMKDFTQIINILLQLGFFMIPVFWNEADMKPDVVMVLKLNPVFYIVQGYRDSLLDGVPFWEHPLYTAYYWIVSGILFAAGAGLFKKSRKHFADLI
jgi:ABC-type polysaccharide/polyol phosphate export systems, permease component